MDTSKVDILPWRNNYVAMGLLDIDDDPKPLYTPPQSRRYEKQTILSQQSRDEELNNLGREEDYATGEEE